MGVFYKIIYTHTDEAPALATYAFLPVIQRFAKPLGVSTFSSTVGMSEVHKKGNQFVLWTCHKRDEYVVYWV